MQLIFQEEARNGTAPVILGASRDNTKDQERLRNLPPPPKLNQPIPPMQNNRIGAQAAPTMPTQPRLTQLPMGQTQPPSTKGVAITSNPVAQPSVLHIPNGNQGDPTTGVPLSTQPPYTETGPPVGQRQDPNYRPSASIRRTIKENDGFVTTVGNPELAAKYGNKSNYRSGPSAVETASSTPPTSTPPSFTGRTSSPFAQRGRYVTYDAVNNKAGQFTRPTAMSPGQPPVRPQGVATQFSGQTNKGVKVFNPAQHQQQQQRPQQRQQFQQHNIPPVPSTTGTIANNSSPASPVTSPTSRFGATVARPVSPAKNAMSRPVTPPSNAAPSPDKKNVEYTQGSFT
uniref:Uncharacterized protein n=1 Tax=Aplanochytrium stocchinoi TaxID=215587 RepID=A0A7S3PPT5_9STRA